MIIPPIGGLGAGLSIGQAEGLTHASSAAPLQGALPSEGSAAPVEGGAAGGEGFGSELSEAISSLEKTQQSSASAAQALATGSVKDPASAVVTVEDAQMAMQLAAQIRSKATEAAQTIFQTQV
jgi:flagellar hook-basal body complex protein FliE